MAKTRSIHLAEHDVSQLATSLFAKVRDIKASHPGVAHRIDTLELEIRERLEEIRAQIGKLNRQDQELVKVLVINGLYRTADEVLIDGSSTRLRSIAR